MGWNWPILSYLFGDTVAGVQEWFKKWSWVIWVILILVIIVVALYAYRVVRG